MFRFSTVLSRGWRGPTGRRFVFKGIRRRARAPTISATCSTASRSRSKMPKRTDIKSILIIGAGPIVIGQACEFDYSGAQACKGLREGGHRVGLAHSREEALQVQAGIGFPVVLRPSFTLGGTGGGIAYNREEFIAICERGLDASPTKELLIEESVIGWKEFEMEVVRDREDNCIIVCS